MSRPSQAIIQGLLRQHNHHLHRIKLSQSNSSSSSSSPSCCPVLRIPFATTRSSSSPSSNLLDPSVGFSNITNLTQSELLPSHSHSFAANPAPSNGTFLRLLSLPQQISHFSEVVGASRASYSSLASPPESARRLPRAFSCRVLPFPNQIEKYAGFRFFSAKSSDFSNVNGGLRKKVLDKPVTAVSSALSRYSEAIGLQFESFYRRNYPFLLGAAGVVVCALLWRIMFGIANTFVHLSEGMAKYGFLALSSAMVVFAGLYIRSRFTINPDKIYRMAMRRLNTSAGILEVMGAPLTGTDLRAFVMSGGGITLKKFKPRIRSKRCFLIFPITGSEGKGLVSVEVKKKKGQYDMKLLAVDVPMASGPDQRLFLIGDEEEYRVGGGLISELRDPVVKAMAATKEFDQLDQIEDEEKAERDRMEAGQKNREEIEKLEQGGN